MEKICITQIAFLRTIFKADGKIADGLAVEGFLLQEEETGEELPLPDVRIADSAFTIEISTLAIHGDLPLPTGDWLLLARAADGTRLPLYVSDALYDRICQYEESEVPLNLEADKSEKQYLHVYSRLRKADSAFYLQAQLVLPPQTPGILTQWKHNLKKRHKDRLRVVRKGIFKLGFRFFNRVVKKNGRRVLFTSESRSEIGGNEAFIYRRMLARGMDQDYEFRFDFKPSIKSHRSLKNKLLFTWYLATSDYIFVDDYQPEIYLCDYDPQVKVIQVWHACGAFKTVGFERLGAKGAPALNTRIHKCYTHVLVSSEHSARHNAEAFAIDRRRFYPTGVPRTDIFFDPDYQTEVTARMRAAFPQIAGASQVILYAPTFRGINARDAHFPVHVLHMEKLGAYLKESSSVMILKMHPFVRERPQIPQAYADCFIDASQEREVNDILFVTDLLITDYSSVIYEASLLHIPMLFYAFDLEQYEAERGFYEPFADIVPGKIVKTLPQLLAALRTRDYESEKLSGFIEKNFTYTDGRSTDRAIDLIFGAQSDH